MMSSVDPMAIRQGDRLALAKALTAIENGTPESQIIQEALFPYTGNAHLVGITGASGTGKSTLVNKLALALRGSKKGSLKKIAVIAVDPSSPFSGGALLGDRIRMQDLVGEEGIFIRSMASRGAMGGLAHNTAAFATVLDGAGYDPILIETVGAGQTEVEIAQLAHTVIVVEAPGLGDDIQAIKAGILEIADILVVNKADKPGAENTVRSLQAMLALAKGENSLLAAGKHMRQQLTSKMRSPEKISKGWAVPVLSTVATEGKGTAQLVQMINKHRAYLASSGLWQVKENERLRRDLEVIIHDLLVDQWERQVDPDQLEMVVSEVIQRKYPPVKAAESLLSIKS